MRYPIEASTLRIIHPENRTVGTGFLVTNNLALTCAHVILDADAYSGDVVQVQFTGRDEKVNALVLPEHWLEIDGGDVAILKLESIPDSITPLRLGPSADSRPGNHFYSFGYATAADVQGIIARGTIDGYLPQHKLLQLQASQASHGISGAPVLDEKRGVVVGMITKGHTELGRNEETTFATPSEVIWQACPQLKPLTPVLPKRSPLVKGINYLPYDYANRIQNFLTEYLGTTEQPEPFGGRDDALKELNDWLDTGTPRLLLAAPAGRGKSALLVRWLDNLLDREDLAIAFVPISVRFRTNLASTFFATLAARLAYLHGEDMPTNLEISTDVWRGLISTYLSKPLPDSKTLLVVLDGLDEAGDWEAGTDLVPANMPHEVRVVVSARFLAGDADIQSWLALLGWERKITANSLKLNPLTSLGVGDVLHCMGFPLDELSHRVDIVAELYRLSEGDPLLVKLYVEDLWSRGEQGSSLQLEDLRSIKPGYEGYFDRWWDDQKKLWGKEAPLREKSVRLVFNLLCGALGGLTEDDLVALDSGNELNTYSIEDSLQAVKRLVIGITDERREREISYVLTHPKLRDHFWERLTQKEQNELEARFVAWGERAMQALIEKKLKPRDMPLYLLQYYGAHLTRAHASIESFLHFINYPYWHQTWFEYEGAYDGYFLDVLRLWNACRVIDQELVNNSMLPLYSNVQIRCALIKASLHSLAEKVPVELLNALIKAGMWSSARALGFILQVEDPKLQSDMLVTIAPQLPELLMPQAYNIAEDLLVSHRWIGNIHCSDALVGLAPYLPPFYLLKAIETIRKMKDESVQWSALTGIAPFLPEPLLRDALSFANEIKMGEIRTFAISRYLPEPERIYALQQAIQAALDSRSVGEWEMANNIGDLAPHVTQTMLFDAIDGAQSHWSGYWRCKFLLKLIPHLSVKDREKIVHNLLLEIQNADRNDYQIWGNGQVEIFSLLVPYLPESSLGMAIETIQMIEGEDLRAEALILLIPRLPKFILQSVIDQDNPLKKRDLKDQVLAAFTSRLAALGDFEQAFGLKNKITNGYWRALALTNIASYQSGQRQIQLLHEASSSVSMVMDQELVIKLIISLSSYLPDQKRKKYSQIALDLAQKIKYEDSRARALIWLIPHLPKTLGERAIEKALSAVKLIDNYEVKGIVFTELIPILPNIERAQAVDEAYVALNNIEDQVTRLLSMIKLIPYLINPNKKKVALDILNELEAIPNYYQIEIDKSRILVNLAPYLTKPLLRQALDLTQGLGDQKYSAITKLTSYLPSNERNNILLKELRGLGEPINGFVFYYVRALAKLGPYLLEPDRSHSLQAAVSKALETDFGPYWHWWIPLLAELGTLLPQHQRFKVFQKALNTLQENIDNLSWIYYDPCVGCISSMTPYMSDQEQDKLLILANNLKDDFHRAFELVGLLPFIPESKRGHIIQDAMKASLLVEYQDKRSDLFASMVPHLYTLQPPEFHLLWSEVMFNLSTRSRQDFLSDLQALAPVLFAFYSPEYFEQIINSVLDVNSWWP